METSSHDPVALAGAARAHALTYLGLVERELGVIPPDEGESQYSEVERFARHWRTKQGLSGPCADPYGPVYHALREAFIPIESRLRELAGWTRGVPFSGLQFHDRPLVSVMERAERRSLETGEEGQNCFGVELYLLLEQMREEYREFLIALDAIERAGGETVLHPEAKGVSGDGDKTELTGEAKALALLVQHPEWNDTEIASHVPCSRTSLYRWPRYTAAREALRAGRKDRPRADEL